MRHKSFWIACVLILQVFVSSFTNASSFNSAAESPKKEPANGKVSPTDWPMYGRDLAGSHYNPLEKAITPTTVSRLKTKWIFETEGDVSSQPIVVNGVVYFGSWDGKEYAVDAKTGKKIWEFEDNPSNSSRSSAAYAEGVLYYVDISGRLYALDAKTGKALWKTKLDEHKDVVGTSAPIYHNGRIYIGVASHEEGGVMKYKNYACCTFRGGVAAFDAKTGAKIWRYYVIPEEPKVVGKDKRGIDIVGPAGGAVWSTVAVHPQDKRVYVTTGNQYTGPASKYPNAVVALDLASGKLIWSYQATPKDIWTFNCNNDPDCSDLDVDFGSIPVSVKGAGGKMLIAAGQKSGWVYALDPKAGTEVWRAEAGTGGKLGGVEFGLSSDGANLYAGISNAANRNRQGWVTALDGATGKILWKTLNEDKGSNFGPITVTGTGADKLVYAGSSNGHVYIYDAKDGKVLWQFDTGGAVGGGATVVDGVMYVGSGYAFLRVGKPNNKLYAFSIDGK
jgi:polyvinyl alcohol dehydrogenase (cytochrome)